MTFLEGFKQAARELGHTDAEIEMRLRRVTMIAPMPVDPNQEIPAGYERKFIETIKATGRDWMRKMKEDPKATTEQVRRIVERKVKLN